MLIDEETAARQRMALDRALRHIGASVTSKDIAAFADPAAGTAPDDARRNEAATGPHHLGKRPVNPS